MSDLFYVLQAQEQAQEHVAQVKEGLEKLLWQAEERANDSERRRMELEEKLHQLQAVLVPEGVAQVSNAQYTPVRPDNDSGYASASVSAVDLHRALVEPSVRNHDKSQWTHYDIDVSCFSSGFQSGLNRP